MTATAAPFRQQGARITAAREKAGLSKTELARRLAKRHDPNPSHADVEANRKRLNRSEAGKHQPKVDFLVAIAEETGASLAELLNGDDEDEEESHLVTALVRNLRALVRDELAQREGAPA